MRNLVLERVDVSFQRLPASLDGLRVLQISDLHYSLRSRRYYAVLADRVVAASPDLIVLTGDLVNHRRWWERAADWIAGLPHGVPKVAVPGNWEYRAGDGEEAFRRFAKQSGALPLLNEARRIPVRDSEIQVVGFDDVLYGGFDPAAAFHGVDPDQFVLALCHNPDVLLHTDPDRFDLLLCGHTHGGQIRVPGYGAMITATRLGKRYEAGLYETAPGRYVYVSRGVGEGYIRIRLWCPPEVALFTLRSLRG